MIYLEIARDRVAPDKATQSMLTSLAFKNWTHTRRTGMEKKCTKCGIVKDLSEYYRDKNAKDGKKSQCKQCQKDAVLKWAKDNPEKVRAKQKIYYKRNSEKVKGRVRDWIEKNPERKKESDNNWRKNNHERYLRKSRQWFKDHQEQAKATRKEYYETNKEKLLSNNKEWAENNREKMLEYCRNHKRKRRAESVSYRISDNFRGRINRILKGNVKTESCLSFVGYTKQELMDHLESLFDENMTWDNYGFYGWHVDHIKPISSFDIKSNSCPEFKKCWALSNLQPLWWIDNIKKGAKENW